MPTNDAATLRSTLFAAACLFLASSCLAAQVDAPRVALERPAELTRENRTVTTKHGAAVSVEAGTLAVPQNRARPNGRSWEIPFYRLRSTSERPAAPIFLLAGGPGSSWLDLFEGSEENFEEVQLYRSVADVVLFDQRGGGRSRPELECEGTETLPVDEPLDLERVAAAMRRLSAACRARWEAAGFDLSGLTTLESAADVDALRAALGYQRMTLVGGSYGSHLALAVLRAYPESVERVVLYGVEGPDHTWDDPAGRLGALERIAAATEAAPAFRGKIPEDGLLGALRTVIRRLEAKPERVTIERDGREVTVVVDATAVRLSATGRAGRRSRAWQWPQRILDLYRGDYRAFAEGAVDGRELGVASPMHSMMDCASGVSPERAARYARDPAAGIVGDVNFEYRAICDAWGAPDLGPAFRAPVVSAAPALLLHGTWDTSTPIENAREVAATLSGSQLVEVLEGSHGALYNLLEHWPPMRSLLAAFLRGEPVRFPSQVSLPAVAFEAPTGDH